MIIAERQNELGELDFIPLIPLAVGAGVSIVTGVGAWFAGSTVKERIVSSGIEKCVRTRIGEGDGRSREEILSECERIAGRIPPAEQPGLVGRVLGQQQAKTLTLGITLAASLGLFAILRGFTKK